MTSLSTELRAWSADPQRFADPYGAGARIVRDGIRESGLLETLEAGASAQVSSVLRAAAILGIGIDGVAGQLTAVSSSLAEISETLRNPLRTAASERYRRGLRALREGWLDDAVIEFRAAIDTNRYDPLTHLLLALALIRVGERSPATAELEAAIKYAGSDHEHRPVLAAAALLASQVHQEQGNRRSAVAVLDTAVRRVQSCAELYLARWMLSDSPDDLRVALRRDPTLVVDAIAHDGGRESIALARGVAAEERGSVGVAKAVAIILHALTSPNRSKVDAFSSPDRVMASFPTLVDELMQESREAILTHRSIKSRHPTTLPERLPQPVWNEPSEPTLSQDILDMIDRRGFTRPRGLDEIRQLAEDLVSYNEAITHDRRSTYGPRAFAALANKFGTRGGGGTYRHPYLVDVTLPLDKWVVEAVRVYAEARARWPRELIATRELHEAATRAWKERQRQRHDWPVAHERLMERDQHVADLQRLLPGLEAIRYARLQLVRPAFVAN